MSQISEEKQIRAFKWDGIDTYQKQYATNDQQLYIDVKQIAQDVYHENIEDLELDIFEV